MSSDSEPDAAKEESTWDVGPTEDVVQCLMEYLVDPGLRRYKHETPSIDAERIVAGQMHAVVWLYNYYHRKQKLELGFLDFVQFCKLAVVIRPTLIKFMKLLKESKAMEWNGDADHLSVTEKAIKDACDTALALDASVDVPNIEGWPISKVAVLLVDSKKEHCILKFGGISLGIRSPLEKEVPDSKINSESSVEDKTGMKRKKRINKTSTDSEQFLQLAYDVVKESRGIHSLDLEVLETYVAYSLTKEKSACQFYIMRWNQIFDKYEAIELKFLIDSFQGPLACKDGSDWFHTAVVEYSHMLPYSDFISSWFLGKDLSSKSKNLQIVGESSGKKSPENSNVVQPPLKYNGKDLDHVVENIQKAEVDSCKKTANDSGDGNNKKRKLSSSNEVASHANNGSAKENPKQICDNLDSALNDARRMCLQISEKECDKCDQDSTSDPLKGSEPQMEDTSVVKGSSRTNLEKLGTDYEDTCEVLNSGVPLLGLSRETVNNGNVMDKFEKSCDILESAIKEESTVYPIIVDNNNHKNSVSELQLANVNDSTKAFLDSKDPNEEKNIGIKVYHHKRKNMVSSQLGRHGLSDGANLMVEMNPLKSYDTQIEDEKIPTNNGNLTISSNQNGIATAGNQLSLLHSKYSVEVHNPPTSPDLENALALLYRKRQELYSDICTMEDTLALYEDSIERIRDGDDIGLAHQCIKYIINGKEPLFLKYENHIQENNQQNGGNAKSQSENQNKLSGIFLPGKSSCQDLEYVCSKNNWRLPRYLIRAADGKFVSDVMVEANDLKLSSKGDLECNPYEARESAAAHMMAIIRNASV